MGQKSGLFCIVLEEIQGHLLFSRMSCLINEEFEHQKQRSLDLWKNELFMLNVLDISSCHSKFSFHTF